MSQVDCSKIRAYFPIFRAKDAPAFLDSAASSQKPQVVIDRISSYLSFEHSNIHRGVYRLSAEATRMYEESRAKLAKFFSARSGSEIIFTRGTTESINLVAHSLEQEFKLGDTILLTILEHHSNIVPWQLLAKRKGLKLVFADCTDSASLNLVDFKKLIIEHKPKLVALTALSNSFGGITPVAECVELAKKSGAWVLLDGAQAAAHLNMDLSSLAPDFFACSGHKMYGPTGVGLLYADSRVLERMQPFMGGGDMIETVSTEGVTFAKAPRKFEAGTPAIAEAIALGTAVDFISNIGLDAIIQHETSLLHQLIEILGRYPKVRPHGPHRDGQPQTALMSFSIDGIHPHDISSIADSLNVQIRGGHHCCMPLMKRLGLTATARASFGVYTNSDDLLRLEEVINKSLKIFG